MFKNIFNNEQKRIIFEQIEWYVILKHKSVSFLPIPSYYYLAFIFFFSELCFLTVSYLPSFFNLCLWISHNLEHLHPSFLCYSSSPYFIRLNTCFLHPKSFSEIFQSHLNLFLAPADNPDNLLWKWKVKVTHLCPNLCDPWNIQSMEYSRPEYWSGQLFHSPGDGPNPGIEPRSPALQAESLPA